MIALLLKNIYGTSAVPPLDSGGTRTGDTCEGLSESVEKGKMTFRAQEEGRYS